MFRKCLKTDLDKHPPPPGGTGVHMRSCTSTRTSGTGSETCVVQLVKYKRFLEHSISLRKTDRGSDPKQKLDKH